STPALRRVARRAGEAEARTSGSTGDRLLPLTPLRRGEGVEQVPDQLGVGGGVDARVVEVAGGVAAQADLVHHAQRGVVARSGERHDLRQAHLLEAVPERL